MDKNTFLKKKIVFAVIISFIGTSVSPTMMGNTVENDPFFITRESFKSTSNINKGSLSGYVNDTLMNPIKGALVRICFHETYEENYTDSSGYYKVNNIPICFCLKNCTASKQGYKTEWILLPIDENTTYDFVLTKNKSYSLDPKNQQAIKNFYLQFLESFSLLERLLLPIFNRMLFS